jgi:hypothetical protein
MSHTLDLTHFTSASRSAWGSVFSLIGPAIRVARAVEQRTRPAEEDLRALNLKPSDFDRVLAAERSGPAAE